MDIQVKEELEEEIRKLTNDIIALKYENKQLKRQLVKERLKHGSNCISNFS